MSGKAIKLMKQQKYRFDFGIDNNLYVITFNGKLSGAEMKKMLASVKNHSYENMAEAMQSYLEQHHLEYSNTVSAKITLDENYVMRQVNDLLHTGTCEKLNEHIENTDVYYAVMDYQQQIPEGYEGCYYVLKRTFSPRRETYDYKIIGQTFSCKRNDFEEYGYFSIRQNSGGKRLQNIESFIGKPVLPTFGCVDMMALLLNIDTIKTKEEAGKTAVK